MPEPSSPEGVAHRRSLAWLQEALELLSEERRPPVGAALKQAIARVSGQQFSEEELGYRKFSDFLHFASQAGLINILMEPGKDLRVFLRQPGVPASLGSASAISPNKILRNDLWRAFTERHSDRHWVYDRTLGCAVRHGIGMEDGSFDPRHVPIQAVTSEQESRWMREFAATYPAEADKAIIEASLDDVRNVSWTGLLERRDDIRRSWQHFRLRKLVVVASGWAQGAGLNIEILQEVKPRIPATRRPETVDADLGPDVSIWGSTATLRNRLHSAIDRMSRNDLLRLSVPLEFFEQA